MPHRYMVARIKSNFYTTESGLLFHCRGLVFLITLYHPFNTLCLMRITSFIKSFFWVVPFIFFVSGYITLHLLTQSKKIETPDLIGLSITDALAKLSAKNLNAQILESKKIDTMPHGTVLDQTPSPASLVTCQQTIFLIISLQASNVLPDCTGKTLQEIATLLPAGSYRTIFIPDTQRTHICLAEYSETSLSGGNQKILYSANSMIFSWIKVPLYVGKTADKVQSSLENASLPYAFYPNITDPELLKNLIVTQQQPLAGSFINKNNPPLIQLQLNN